MKETQIEREREGWEKATNLVDHLVLEDGAAIEHFHGDTLTSLSILCELNLSKGSFTDRPPNLILADFPHHHTCLSLFLFLSLPSASSTTRRP